MQYRYTSKKQKFDKAGVNKFYLHFQNGDSVSLCKQELLDLSINLYDALIADGNGFSPVAESGRIVISVAQKPSGYQSAHLYNMSEFRKDRKSYIENRCVNEGGLCAVEFCDDLNWGRTLYGDLSAEMKDGHLILTYLPKRSGGKCDGAEHTVSLRDVTKKSVRAISLDFENCEGFDVYDDEIVDLRLQFDPELCEGSGKLYRRIESGYLTVKLNRRNTFRNTNFLILPHPTFKQLENRLVDAAVRCTGHDICHLYIRYHDNLEEQLEIDDIRPEEELERLRKTEEEGERPDGPDFIGGYCQRQDDGSIKIMFGNSLYGKFNID